jgi:hypothetical protein
VCARSQFRMGNLFAIWRSGFMSAGDFDEEVTQALSDAFFGMPPLAHLKSPPAHVQVCVRRGGSFSLGAAFRLDTKPRRCFRP